MTDDIIARIDARCAESAAFSRGAAEMKRRAIAACEACVSDVTGTVSDADEAAQLAVAACVAAVRVTPWPTMTVNDAPALAWGPLPSVAEVEAHIARGGRWLSLNDDGTLMLFVLHAHSWGVTLRLSGGVVEREPFDVDRDTRWRPIDGDGMPVARWTP